MNIVAGQGLAGTVLALTLLERGEEVRVIDNGHRSSSSMVAAGLWNPIVFRRINKSWLADEVIAELESFYPAAEPLLNARFFHPMRIFRKHGSALEAELWAEKKPTKEFSPYLADEERNPDPAVYKSFEFGHGTVNRAGYVDLPVFLGAARKYFAGKGILAEAEFALPDNADALNNFRFEGKSVKRIIDCRGYKTAESPWFRYLPFGLTKGEVLTVRCKDLNLDEVFNAGFFLQPLGNDLYRMGATFNWSDRDEEPTGEARAELMAKFRKHLNAEVEIISQKAGVRPTVQDRRPLIGCHPEAEKLCIFNGLGTKGVMLAPLFAKVFCAWLFEGVPLPDEVNIDRFRSFLGQESPVVDYPAPRKRK